MKTTPHPLPHIGPAWAGSLMGTSITGSLVSIHFNVMIARFIVGAAVCVLIAVLWGWLADWLRRGQSGFTLAALPAWSMVAMGTMSLGSATETVWGAFGFHVMTTIIGTVMSIFVFLPQVVRLLAGSVPTQFPGVLPLVTPMVAATNLAQIGNPSLGGLMFTASLCIAVPAFIRVYASPGRHPRGQQAPTAWIPLGIVGQSAAAAILLSDGEPTALFYSSFILLLGVPASLWACFVHWPAVLRWSDYGPGWWACTFPVGTCSLGTHLLAVYTNAPWLDIISQGLLILLIIHVLLAISRLFTSIMYNT